MFKRFRQTRPSKPYAACSQRCLAWLQLRWFCGYAPSSTSIDWFAITLFQSDTVHQMRCSRIRWVSKLHPAGDAGSIQTRRNLV